MWLSALQFPKYLAYPDPCLEVSLITVFPEQEEITLLLGYWFTHGELMISYDLEITFSTTQGTLSPLKDQILDLRS